jgi:hypothetical protein
MNTAYETKQADERGRISLGPAFANRTFLVEVRGDDLVLRPARVIPEREAWLYQNEDALARVRKGLAQAKRREFANAPSPQDARRFADETNDPSA